MKIVVFGVLIFLAILAGVGLRAAGILSFYPPEQDRFDATVFDPAASLQHNLRSGIGILMLVIGVPTVIYLGVQFVFGHHPA